MLSSARLGGSICATGAALWTWLANFVAGAVFSASGCVFALQATCGSCLQGLDVVERAARGLNLLGRRSTLETGHRFRSRRSIFCIWHLGVCLRGRGNIWLLSREAGRCRARGSGAQSA